MAKFDFSFENAVREDVYVKIFLTSPSGGGKALTLDSDLMTPTGSIKMKDVKVGDMILGTDGEGHRVLGVYPQGKKECYRVTFSDGSHVDCSKDHLWTVRKRGNGDSFVTLTLNELLQNGIYNNGWVYFIPMTKPVQYHAQEQKIDPYVMGVLISDGSLTVSHAMFTNTELDVVNRVESKLDNDCELHCYQQKDRIPDYAICDINCNVNHENKVVSYLKELGLIGCKSCDKFIPDNYKYGSIEQRIELLRGLIDTDGSVYGLNKSNKSSVEFSTTSYQLALDVKFVIESLGGTAKIKERQTRYTDKNGDKSRWFKSYRLYIKMPIDIVPFSSVKHYSSGYKPQTNAYRSIRSVDYIGELECQCITVDADNSLFLTNNFIATHNTFSSLRLATGMADEIERIKGKRPPIVMFNTESSRGLYYANEFEYSVFPKKNQNLKQEDFTTQLYIDWINYTAELVNKNDGIEPILIIDSATPAWDSMKAQQQKMGGTFKDWGRVQPIWNEFKRTIVNSKAHIICCARGRTAWEIDTDDKGKKTIRKLGVGSDMREGFDYEFTCCFMIDNQTHAAEADKDNSHLFESRAVNKPLTEEDGENLIKWANSGSATKSKTAPQPVAEVATPVVTAPVEGSVDVKEIIKSIKSTVDTLMESATEESKPVVRTLVADTIKQFVKNSKGTPVADYRIIKDATVAQSVLDALNALNQ